MHIPAIILAAGASRRLGQPKQLVRAGQETLLGRTVRVTREAGAEPVFVVLGAHREVVFARVDLTGTECVANPQWEQGIASSIHAGVIAVQQKMPEASAVLLLVCDQPRLTAEHLHHLIAAHQSQLQPTIVASAYAGIAGIPAIFPVSEFPELLKLSGDEGAKRLLHDSRCPLVTVPFDGGEVDVDTVADLDRF